GDGERPRRPLAPRRAARRHVLRLERPRTRTGRPAGRQRARVVAREPDTSARGAADEGRGAPAREDHPVKAARELNPHGLGTSITARAAKAVSLAPPRRDWRYRAPRLSVLRRLETRHHCVGTDESALVADEGKGRKHE